jgi:F0F1-type ATP synthase assembly protein I
MPQPLGGRDLLGLGGLLAGSVVGFTLLGLLVDHLAGSSPIGAVVGVALGMLAGGVGFAARVRRALHG